MRSHDQPAATAYKGRNGSPRSPKYCHECAASCASVPGWRASTAAAVPPGTSTTLPTVNAEAFGSGGSYKEIARQLDLSPATVRFYLRTIYEKLQVRDKGELASLLRQEDLQIDGATLAVRYRQLHQTRLL